MTIEKYSKSLKQIFQRSQLGIFLLSFLLLCMLVGTIGIISLNSYTERSVKLLSETLTEKIQPALVFQDYEYLDKTVASFMANYDLREVRVIDHDQHVMLSKELPATINETLLTAILEKFVYNKASVSYIYDGERKIASLWVYQGVSHISDYIFRILVGFLFSLILTLVVWWYSIQRIYGFIISTLNPLMYVASLVREQKAYNLRFDPSQIKEFNVLIQVFNQLLDEIQSWHTNLQNENKQLSFQAHHDELTSLPNRHVFYKTLEQLFADKKIANNSALVFIDNNDFKRINDTYGHQAGDEVLKETASRLKKRIRHQDVLVRIGGDEFAIIIHSVQKAEYLSRVAESLLSCCDMPLQYEGKEIKFGFSVGIAYSAYANNSEELIRQADKAMYEAKTLEQHWAIFKLEDNSTNAI